MSVMIYLCMNGGKKMIEWGLLAVGFGCALLFNPKTEREKMENTFKNVRFGLKNQFPFHVRTKKTDDYVLYIYKLPYGLMGDKKLEEILRVTLGKPVGLFTENNCLFIKVYKGELTKFNYDWSVTEKWVVPVGKTLDEMIYHNFDHIPHMCVSGMTRQGKTVFLKLILAHLINNNDEAEFYILDLKGGLEFSKYNWIKHVKEVSSNAQEAKETLRRITNQMKKDIKHFIEKNINNVVETNINRRTFIIVDEAAELADSKECQKHLSEIARLGGALGYRLIFATQYPTADTLPRQIKQNADAKISFRLPTEYASRVAIDEGGAEKLEVPGRAIYRTAEKHIVQVPFIKDEDILEKLRRFEVDTTREKTVERRKDTLTFG